MNSTSNQTWIFHLNTSDDMPKIFEELLYLGEVLNTLTPLVFSVLFIIGVVGNILVAYVTLTPSTNRFTTRPIHSMLVLNLAAADLIYLVSSLPYQAVSYSVPGWIYGATMCPLLHFLSVWTMAVSIFTMCSLAFMRFAGLVLPFRFKNSSLAASGGMGKVVMTLILWLMGALLASPNLVHFQIVTEPQEHCTWPDQRSHNAYWSVLVTCTYVIPLLLVSTLYVLIAVEVVCFMKKKDARTHHVQADQGRYRKLTTMITTLISAFLICWFPYHLYALIQVSGRYDDPSFAVEKTVLQLLGHCFSYAHASVNPIIYTFAAPEFRHSLCASIRRHSSNTTGPCSWRYSEHNRDYNCPYVDPPQTKMTCVASEPGPEPWLKVSTAVHLEMSPIPHPPTPQNT